MSGPLKGKSAVITGSNSGIGLGVAEALAAAGCNVALNSFTDRKALVKVKVAVGYGSDIDRVFALLLEAARRQPRRRSPPERCAAGERQGSPRACVRARHDRRRSAAAV